MEYTYKLMTVGLILEGDKILLGMKKRGFGQGRWNGFGGRKEEGETIDDTFVREFREECGIDVLKSEKMGVIDFEFNGNSEILQVHFYKVLEYRGEPIETDEMRAQWFNVNEIPYDSMWPDDRHWMPLFLQGKRFRGDIYFENQDKILESDIKEVQGL